MSVISGILNSNASEDASAAQSASAQAGIAAQNEAAAQMRQRLDPYSTAGTGALGKQQDLLGVNGNTAQKSAIDAIKNSFQYGELNKQGQDAILQNASATGGLRGGNTQAALAQFSPALLNSLISDQYTKLGGITSIGENAGAQSGNMGMQSANSVSSLLSQQGRAVAGGILGSTGAMTNSLNTGFNLAGNFAKSNGGWGGLGTNNLGSSQTPTGGYDPSGNYNANMLDQQYAQGWGYGD
jgi:hypothetical protein